MIKRQVKTSREVFLAKIKENLSKTKGKLVSEIADRLKTQREAPRDDCLDICDLASEENEREISTMLSERERLKIAQLDDALSRIASARYGMCASCGLEISGERLHAMPFARLCCDCQEDRERAAKSHRRTDKQDVDTYKIGAGGGHEDSMADPLMNPGSEFNLERFESGSNGRRD